jgi:putative peptide zinc metalloprotease protein
MGLGLLVGAGTPTLSGYVSEHDIDRIAGGAKGRFYAEFSINKQYDVVLRHMDQATVTEIHWPELSSVYNGPLPSERDRSGAVRPLPRYNFYAAKLDLAGGAADKALPPFIARGTVRLEAAPTNLSKILIKRAISVIIREGGF